MNIIEPPPLQKTFEEVVFEDAKRNLTGMGIPLLDQPTPYQKRLRLWYEVHIIEYERNEN